MALWWYWPNLMGSDATSLNDADDNAPAAKDDEPADDNVLPDSSDGGAPLVAPSDHESGQPETDDESPDRGKVVDDRSDRPLIEDTDTRENTERTATPLDPGGLTEKPAFPDKRNGGIDPLGEESLDDLVNRIDRGSEDPPEERPDTPDPTEPEEKPDEPVVEKQAVPSVALQRAAREQVIKELGQAPREDEERDEHAAELIERVRAAEDNAAVSICFAGACTRDGNRVQ